MESMNELHGLLAKELKSQILNGTKVINKETGELESVSCTPATMNVVRQFLKDNNVESDGAIDPNIASLTEELPFDEQRTN